MITAIMRITTIIKKSESMMASLQLCDHLFRINNGKKTIWRSLYKLEDLIILKRTQLYLPLWLFEYKVL
jgi:hypothetical protein